MRYWEFLIQQEGDQTWLPLESRQVEILEGRYRMAAHTSYDSRSVEIRVSQLLLDEMPPRRRVRKRKANTNDSGLLAIFPFMQLSPGHWEIECNSPDVIDDFLGEGGWQYSVQLQVTPRDEDDWDPDWAETAVDHDQNQSLGAGSETLSDDDDIPNNLTTGTFSQEAECQLRLKQQAYVTQLGQSLTLAGQFSQTAGPPLTNSQLVVELRDPQTATLVKDVAFDVPTRPSSLPSPFAVTVTLPDELSTQVLLGAISLVGQINSADHTALTSASFTVTLGLAQMLDAISNQSTLGFEEEISIFPGSTEAFVPPSEKAEALLTSDTPFVPKEIIPAEGLTLPPQLKPPGDAELDDPDRQPELPRFPIGNDSSDVNQAGDAMPARTAASAEHTLNTSAADLPAADLPIEPPAEEGLLETLQDESADIDEFDYPDPPLGEDSSPAKAAPVDARLDEPLPFAEPKIFELSSIEDDDLDLELATAALEEPTSNGEIFAAASPPLESSSDTGASNAGAFASEAETESRWNRTTASGATSIDRAFEGLQLRERFWQKLSLFTQDGYRQSLEVKRALQFSEPRTEGNRQSNEFVVHEPTPKPSRWSPKKDEQKTPTEPVQVLPPALDVPQQELVAGDWLAIRVRIPAGDYQPYVKVWMNDLQTRTVIEPPRLLMQFIPNDNNELETLMRLQVPQGCLELQFAAISVDMTTLQESRKVVQNRRVMPPDDALSVFDDWDI
ncbi:MAG: hypothetical protein KTR27_00405 [Leptolyngbyaceae cyanobacterium MAG.088]|nr:hypothetical protein [Leptolyngbyaceae cyanobacterium MAG.088]